MVGKMDIFRSEKAATPVIGIIIIIGICIASITMIAMYSAPTFNSLEDNAKTQKIEQAFTVFDSRVSKVALGESPMQRTDMNLMGGSLSVNEETATSNTSNIHVQIFKNDVVIDEFNCSMGTIEYTYEDRKVAYEGGGVWSKYPNGRSIMISPPEFHYNGETLTLPLMKVNGDSSAGGKTNVGLTISSDNMPSVLYPNTALGSARINPLSCDHIYIYIKSDYYDAWADYTNTLIDTSSTTSDANKTAIVRLDTIPNMGTTGLSNQFRMGRVNQSNQAPMYDFSFDLEAGHTSGLKNLKHNIQATSGDRTLTYYLQKRNSPNSLDIEIIYEDKEAGSEYIEYWKGDDLFPVNGEDEDADSMVDLLNETFMLTYSPKNSDHADPDFSWDNPGPVSTIPNCTINNGDKQSLYNLTQHYMRLITEKGSVKFNLDGGAQDKVDYDESTYTLKYDSAQGITYLHVTINEIDADLN